MRSYGRIATPLLALTLAGGCYNSGPYDAFAGSASETDAVATDSDHGGITTSPISTVTTDTNGASAGSTSGTAGGTGTGSTTGEELDEPPTIDLLTVNGAAESLKVVAADNLHVEAIATDDVGVASVELFYRGESVGVRTEAPYAWDIVVNSADDDNGEYTAYAVAVDTADQESAKVGVDVEVLLPAGGTQVWQAIDDDGTLAKAHGVAVDSFGDVIVVGFENVSKEPVPSRMRIRKYRGTDGEILWERYYPEKNKTAPDGHCVARSVAVDTQGIIFVTGELDLDGATSHLWVGKYSSDGLLLGTYKSSVAHSQGNDVAVSDLGGDDDAMIYVVGHATKPLLTSGMLAAFDTDLKPVWQENSISIEGVDSILNAVAVGGDGDFVVAGAYGAHLEDTRGYIAKHKPNKATVWWRASNTPVSAEDVAYDLGITSDGRISGVGRRMLPGYPEALWLFRLDSAGNDIGTEVDTSQMCGSNGCALEIDVDDNHLLGGALRVAPGPDFLVAKKDADWKDAWVEAYDGYDGKEDRCLGVAADGVGYVYGVGFETKDGVERWWISKHHP